MKYLERFEYVCKDCERKGTVLDVLLNPEVLLIRGYCEVCKKRGTYKVIDIEALRQEHEAIALEEAEGRKPDPRVAPVNKKGEVIWKWELQGGSGKVVGKDEG